MPSFFLRLFLLFWLPVLPFVLAMGARLTLAWTLFSALVAWLVSKNSRDVLRDFIAHVDSGKALETPGEMDVRTSFLYGPLLRRFKSLQRSLGEEVLRGRREKELLATVLANVSDGVIALDSERNVVFCNEAARGLCDVKKADVFGRAVEEVFPVSGFHEMTRDPGFFTFPKIREVSAFFENSERTLRFSSSPFGPDGHRGVVVSVRDLSEEARQERDRRDFVANASHDLKTPIMAIRGYLDSILEGDLSSEQSRKFLEKIGRNVERLSELSQKLLVLSESEANSNAHVPIPIAGEVEAIVERYAPLFEARGLSFVHAIRGAGSARGPRDAVGTILGNLLDNALKFTPSPGSVELSCEAVDAVWMLRVTDSGMGIDPEDQPRVFERFYRADRARSSEGSGLGLAIVRNLVEKMGGEIHLTSRPAFGTTFEIRLPRS